MEPQTDYIADEDLVKIDAEKKSALQFRERRHDDWTDNYTLYRDKVITNRLTQRQTINIPLMRYGLQTILKDNDDAPMLYFQNKDNNQQKEIFYNEYWNKMAEVNRLAVRDRVDKKQALLFGRTFKKLNIKDGMFTFEVIDPQDMLVERHVDPADLDSARCLIQTNIYKTLTEVINTKQFNKGVVADLKMYYSKDSTTEESEHTFNAFSDKKQRMSNMGLIDSYNPLVGETYIELNEVYRKEWNDTLEDTEIIMYVVASTEGGMFKLFKKPLHEIIGDTEDDYWYNHFPYTSWGTDPERTDFWSDGPADTLRQPNKVLNSWISQLVENRTLRNFNMHYYDSSNPSFVPQTFQPISWGWYPVPGKPDDVIKDVQVPDLSESLDEIQYVISVAEKAVAASGTQTGEVAPSQVTLGEVQLAVTNAQERTKSMGLFYTDDWKNFGTKYTKMLKAKSKDLATVEVSKKGRQTDNIYTREISPKDWLTKSGYNVEVKVKEDKDAEDTATLQKLNVAMTVMPTNVPLNRIYKEKLLNFSNLTTDEQKEVMDFEKQGNMAPPMQTPLSGQPTASQGMSTMPTTPPMGA
jgi:hypothetical protein